MTFIDSSAYSVALIWYLTIGPNSCRYVFTQYTYVKIYFFLLVFSNMFLSWFSVYFFKKVSVSFWTIREHSNLFKKNFFTFFLLPNDYELGLFFLTISLVVPLIFLDHAGYWFFHTSSPLVFSVDIDFNILIRTPKDVKPPINIIFRLPKWIRIEDYWG